MRLLPALVCLFVTSTILAAEPNVKPRDGATNSRVQFESGKGHVVFLGGSITEMEGYRPLVASYLKQRFPKCDFTVTNAGISSTCSATGAFRLASDVLAKGPVDLLFVEFAVNDDQDAGHARRECIRGLEGIIRHLRAHNPHADVVVTFFVNEGMLKEFANNRTPLTVAAHDAVAEHYRVPSVNVAKEVADRIAAGTLTWKEYGGVHPGKPGNALAAGMVTGMLDENWKTPLPVGAKKVSHDLPRALVAGNYEQGRFVALNTAKIASGWTLAVPEWKTIPGQWRDRFRGSELLSATKPGAELTLDFHGQAVGAYILAGPDAGVVQASIDGGAFQTIDLYHKFSGGLHYPRTVLFAADLSPGKRTLTLRLADTKNAKSTGTAARFVQFVAN